MGVVGVMIGRSALSNPAVFDALKNELGLNTPKEVVPSVKEMKVEYDAIHAQLSGSERYRDAFINIVGKRTDAIYY
jgi:tRNA-dihydrouridine synthase